MNHTMRLFIAIELPEAVKSVLLQTAAQMGQHLPDRAIRWVKPEQLHLTLRFLGDTAVSKLPALQDQLSSFVRQQSPFQLRLNGVGAFPSRKRPRVVWAGLGGDVATLQRMQAALEDIVVQLGWPPERRPFSPHITVGRVKDNRQVQALDWAVALAAAAFEVREIQLVQSELRPSGSVYTTRHVARF